MFMKKNILLMIGFMSICITAYTQLPRLNEVYKAASVQTKNSELIVSTGKVSRKWKWTGKGLVTTSFSNSSTGKSWVNLKPRFSSDWSFFGFIDETPAKLINLEVHQSNDEGFTSPHLEVIAEIEYPSVASFVKYQIWAYPQCPGIRTQLWVKGELAKYDKTQKVRHPDSFIDIRLTRGNNSFPYDSKIYEMPWFASVTRHKESVYFTLSNLKRDKKYILGLSWWDFENEGGIQRVSGIPYGSDQGTVIIPEKEVPYLTYLPYKKWERHETILNNIPVELISDSLQILVENVKGIDAVISELWVYEAAIDEEITDYLIGDRTRIDQLVRSAPPGYQLAGYFDCGNTKNMNAFVPIARVDYLPFDGRNLKRRYFGYNNDTQNRHTPATHLLEEKLNYQMRTETVNWASGLSVEDRDEGVILLKESHKCPNQYGVGTGNFKISDLGVENTGTPLIIKDINEDEYKWSWASWMLAYNGGEDYRELAIKRFDRLRFPVDLDRDVYVKADTWGSGTRGTDCRVMGTEVEVLPEIESVADLGIDGLQIDDGWQVGLSSLSGQKQGWKPHPDVYPDGWKNVKVKAEKFGVKMALWAPGYSISLEELKWNYDQVGFFTWKLDFGLPASYNGLNTMQEKARDFLAYTGHKAQIAWDVTENDPRYGYYWAREFGCMWLSNRKPKFHYRNVPQPWLMLRENWELAKYVNINKFQLPVKNFALVDKNITDAYLHSQSYAVALGLPGTPVFFQTTRYYGEKDRKEIRNLLNIYKRYRKEMFDAYVFPVGEEPTNSSWAGFQWYHPEKSTGYLMIFREINNDEQRKTINLKFLKDEGITLTNVVTEASWRERIDRAGNLTLEIENPADFIFLKMEY
jgi:hypothetical protein